jgi:hypothetical protein
LRVTSLGRAAKDIRRRRAWRGACRFADPGYDPAMSKRDIIRSADCRVVAE